MDTKNLAPHQERVVAEKAELDSKLEKLKSFLTTTLFDGIPDEEQIRLQKQTKIMQEYSAILGERIAAF